VTNKEARFQRKRRKTYGIFPSAQTWAIVSPVIPQKDLRPFSQVTNVAMAKWQLILKFKAYNEWMVLLCDIINSPL
jgi:hypothetical protein